MMNSAFSKVVTFSVLVSGLSGCLETMRVSENEVDAETVHVLGDVMSSVDEAFMKANEATQVGSLGTQSCASTSATTCSGNERKITYDSCTLGNLALHGDVKFLFAGGSNCSLENNEDFIRRVPSFEVTGRSGGTLTVSVSNPSTSGQLITRKSSTSYNYEVSGLRRSFRNVSGKRNADFSVDTLEAITISGNSRATRRMMGGTLEIKNNADSSVLSLTPDALKWNSTCSCPVSGSWIGQRRTEDGVVADFNVEINGCGVGTLTVGTESSSVSFERCGAY